MTTSAQVINMAKSQIGIKESPFGSNRQKFGVWYGWNGVPWCAQFISWCFNATGGSGLIGGKSASVALTASRMRARGRYGFAPRVGSLAFFNNYTHIELVVSVNRDGTVNTIGGNTSGSGGSISNGGGVWAKTRSRSLIRGYGYPDYAGSPSIPPPVVRPPSYGGSLTVNGIFNAGTCKWLQRWVGVAQDGVFGPKTKMALQRKLRVTADGVVGPTTIRALQRTVGATIEPTWSRSTTRAIQTYLNRIF